MRRITADGEVKPPAKLEADKIKALTITVYVCQIYALEISE
jgi:hypothetical protein